VRLSDDLFCAFHHGSFVQIDLSKELIAAMASKGSSMTVRLVKTNFVAEGAGFAFAISAQEPPFALGVPLERAGIVRLPPGHQAPFICDHLMPTAGSMRNTPLPIPERPFFMARPKTFALRGERYYMRHPATVAASFQENRLWQREDFYVSADELVTVEKDGKDFTFLARDLFWKICLQSSVTIKIQLPCGIVPFTRNIADLKFCETNPGSSNDKFVENLRKKLVFEFSMYTGAPLSEILYGVTDPPSRIHYAKQLYRLICEGVLHIVL
jgi:hypothetical protein